MLYDPKWEGPSKVQEILHSAADLLERDGWIQNRTFDDYGGMCAYGAVLKAASMGLWANMALLKLAKEIGGDGTCALEDVVAWNDTAGRTKEEVIAALRGC